MIMSSESGFAKRASVKRNGSEKTNAALRIFNKFNRLNKGLNAWRSLRSIEEIETKLINSRARAYDSVNYFFLFGRIFDDTDAARSAVRARGRRCVWTEVRLPRA